MKGECGEYPVGDLQLAAVHSYIKVSGATERLGFAWISGRKGAEKGLFLMDFDGISRRISRKNEEADEEATSLNGIYVLGTEKFMPEYVQASLTMEWLRLELFQGGFKIFSTILFYYYILYYDGIF